MPTAPDRTYAPGDGAWFEYHCWESFDSADADLWVRSHQQVTVLTVEVNDAEPGSTFEQRAEAATPWTYGSGSLTGTSAAPPRTS